MPGRGGARGGEGGGFHDYPRGLQVKDGRLKSPEELDHYRAGKMR